METIGIIIGVLIIVILLALLITYLAFILIANKYKNKGEKFLKEKGIEKVVNITNKFLTKK